MLVFFFGCFSIPKVYPLFNTVLSARMDNFELKVTAALEWDESQEFIPSLNDGFKSEISFQFRLYKKAKGLFAFLGDQLILEKEESYTGYRDFFSQTYVIQKKNSGYSEYGSIFDFLKNYFVISNYRLAEINRDNFSEYYVQARIGLSPVKFEPPLHIITLFGSMNLTSGWIRSDINASEGL